MHRHSHLLQHLYVVHGLRREHRLHVVFVRHCDLYGNTDVVQQLLVVNSLRRKLQLLVVKQPDVHGNADIV